MDCIKLAEIGLIVENVTKDGRLSDSFEGRLLNPGHALEAMWFVMELGQRLERPELIEKAVDISLKMIEHVQGRKVWNGIRNCGGFMPRRRYAC